MLFEKLIKFYKRINWEMAQVPDETILSIKYQGENGQWVFVSTTDEEHGIIVMFARSPLQCPAAKSAEMLDFMNRSNFGMTHGAWVMDRKDGEIRFRVGFDAGDLQFTDEYLRAITLYTNLTMDRYLPGLKAIIENGKSANEAMTMVFPKKGVK